MESRPRHNRDPADPALVGIGPIAASIAEELGDLLTTINGHGDIALEALGDRAPAARASVTVMREAGNRAARLTRELLSLSNPPDRALAPVAESGLPWDGSRESEAISVLLVEGNQVVRNLVHEMLLAEGCEVLVAADPAEALELSDGFHGVIDLLVTDMVLPKMNGRELATRLLARRPDMNVVYTSRYAGEAFVDGGVIAPGTSFLQKPFTTAELTAKVNEIASRRAAA